MSIRVVRFPPHRRAGSRHLGVLASGLVLTLGGLLLVIGTGTSLFVR